jgi:hypothetical protein
MLKREIYEGWDVMRWKRKCISRSIGWVLPLPGFFFFLDSEGKAVRLVRAVVVFMVGGPRKGEDGKEKSKFGFI